MKIIPIPKLIAFWPSLAALYSISSYLSSSPFVTAEELQTLCDVKVTVEKPSIVSTGDIFAFRVRVSELICGNNVSKSCDQVEVELDLLDREEPSSPIAAGFYSGNGNNITVVPQRQVVQVGNDSSGAVFLFRAISTERVWFQVRVRGMNARMLDWNHPELVRIRPPGLEWKLTKDRLIEFTKTKRVELQLFDQRNYPADLRGEEVYDKYITISLQPSHFFYAELLSEVEALRPFNYADRVGIFDVQLLSVQSRLLVLELAPSLMRKLAHGSLAQLQPIEELTSNLENEIELLNEFQTVGYGYFSGCSPTLTCRELEATTAALAALSMAKKWTKEVKDDVLEEAAQYLQLHFVNDKEGKLTMDQLLDMGIAFISYNENAKLNERKLELHPLCNRILTSFNFTHQHSSLLLSKLTFLLFKSNHSRAQEYFTELEVNSSGNQEQRHWNNSLEATAYALRVYLMKGQGLESVLPIVSWLLQHSSQSRDEPQLAGESYSFTRSTEANVLIWALIEFEEHWANHQPLEERANNFNFRLKLECEGEEEYISEGRANFDGRTSCADHPLNFTSSASRRAVLTASEGTNKWIGGLRAHSSYRTTKPPNDTMEGIRDFSLQVNFTNAGRMVELRGCLQIETGDDELGGRMLLAEISLPYNYAIDFHEWNNETGKKSKLMGNDESFRTDELHPRGSRLRSFFLGEEGSRNCVMVRGKRSNLIANENGTFLGWAFLTEVKGGVRKRARKFFQAPSNVPLSELTGYQSRINYH